MGTRTIQLGMRPVTIALQRDRNRGLFNCRGSITQKSTKWIISSLVFLATAATASPAQQDSKAINAGSADITVTASASPQRVRFTAAPSVVQIRLEVYDSAGRKLFDNEVRGGNVLDWHLQDGQAERLADDTYLCIATVKSLSGRITQRIGSVKVEKNSASLQPVDASQVEELFAFTSDKRYGGPLIREPRREPGGFGTAASPVQLIR